MAPPPSSNEFDLLDSIFDELDAEILAKLDADKTAHSAVKKGNGKNATSTLSSRPKPVSASPAPSSRKALQPVSSNGRQQQQQPPSQTRSKEKPIDVKKDTSFKSAASPSVSQSKRLAGPFRPTSVKPDAVPRATKPSSSARPLAQSSKTATPVISRSGVTDSAQEAQKKADAALLHDLDWSDDDDDLAAVQQKSTIVGKGKQPLASIAAGKQKAIATKVAQHAKVAARSEPSAAEQSSRLKAEQLANLRRQPGYVNHAPAFGVSKKLIIR